MICTLPGVNFCSVQPAIKFSTTQNITVYYLLKPVEKYKQRKKFGKRT